MAVYAATKSAVRAISEGLRQEAGDKLRVTVILPGFTRTNFAESVTNSEAKAQISASMDKFAMPPDAIARAMAFAIEQPADVDVGEIIGNVSYQSEAIMPAAAAAIYPCAVGRTFPAVRRPPTPVASATNDPSNLLLNGADT
ncbi:SDR family NAD(P)-dependent oxidoreductase (plasmid) [Cupriavidus sp. KK10]|jgi:short-subunit dehydrogenase|nr:SDR family NAD(P)-dependent oxidoreductase [Cupriavidus sp. KK10]